MKFEEIRQWLVESDADRLEELWRRADAVRAEHVSDAVFLRGLVEISNICARECYYCGIRAGNADVSRYRMSADEIAACARRAVELGYGTLVMQSGEDFGIRRDWMGDVIRRIKSETGLAITLSLGERSDADLIAWRAAGADRYLLRFETSNKALFNRIHPALNGRPADRFEILNKLRDFGYEVGSGVMVGIPGQSYDDLARDIEWFHRLDLDMIGVGPFVPHPDTPLGREPAKYALPHDEQVPATDVMTFKVLALARLVCPRANIPSTTALATINKESGREFGLMRGANVVMPNVTPAEYRCKYEIYPDKACLHETAGHCATCIDDTIAALGRTIGRGRGDSPNRLRRESAAGSIGGRVQP